MHMVRYTVKPEEVARNEELIGEVFAELSAVRPAGLRYATLKLEDGVSFLHLISHDAGSDHLPGRRLGALRAFHADLRERCEGEPSRTEVTVVGTYGLLAPA